MMCFVSKVFSTVKIEKLFLTKNVQLVARGLVEANGNFTLPFVYFLANET